MSYLLGLTHAHPTLVVKTGNCLYSQKSAHEHLTSLPKRRVGTVLSVSTINHERASMYIYSNSLPTNSLNVWTNNNIQLSCGPWKFTLIDPIQEIGPKVGGGRSFARLW